MQTFYPDQIWHFGDFVFFVEGGKQTKKYLEINPPNASKARTSYKYLNV